MIFKNKLLGLLLLLFVISFVSAQSDYLGTFKINENVTIIQTCDDGTNVCDYCNVSSIYYPNSTLSVQNVVMTGNKPFSYNYNKTDSFGTYTINTYCGLGTSVTQDTYYFEVNGSGQQITQAQITLIIIGIIVFLIVMAFFFILAIMFKHPGTKIFLMSLSALTLIVLIGIIASNAGIYLAEFAGLAAIYSQYYIVIITLATASGAGIILWLIYYATDLFNKARGRVPDDD